MLGSVLRVLRPLVRLLLRNGVTYPELTAALKPVFVETARQELQTQGMSTTDSAVTLLSGVHRKDVRELTRGEPAARSAAISEAAAAPLSLSGQVVAAWLSTPAWLNEEGLPRPLARAEFEALAQGVSRDVRPRAVRDELFRLGTVREEEDGQLSLLKSGFAPRAGLAEMAELMAANVGDHAAAAAANLQGEDNFLEQALFVDQLRPESVQRVRQAARAAWNRTLKQVLAEAQSRWTEDQALVEPDQLARRNRRARFGVYFYTEEEK